MKPLTEQSDETWELGVISQVDGANPSPFERPGRVEVVMGREPEEDEVPMTGWVMVRGKRECQEETEKEEMETPEGRRRKQMIQYPYLTWLLREWWGEEDERARGLSQKIAEGRVEEKGEEEKIKRIMAGEKCEVEKWLEREGMGKLEVEKILSN